MRRLIALSYVVALLSATLHSTSTLPICRQPFYDVFEDNRWHFFLYEGGAENKGGMHPLYLGNTSVPQPLYSHHNFTATCGFPVETAVRGFVYSTTEMAGVYYTKRVEKIPVDADAFEVIAAPCQRDGEVSWHDSLGFLFGPLSNAEPILEGDAYFVGLGEANYRVDRKENLEDSIVVRRLEFDFIAAIANRTRLEGSPSWQAATWEVRHFSDVLDPAMVAFIITDKVNRRTLCPLPAPTQTVNVAAVVVPTVIGAVALIALTVGGVLYHKGYSKGCGKGKDGETIPLL